MPFLSERAHTVDCAPHDLAVFSSSDFHALLLTAALLPNPHKSPPVFHYRVVSKNGRTGRNVATRRASQGRWSWLEEPGPVPSEAATLPCCSHHQRHHVNYANSNGQCSHKNVQWNDLNPITKTIA